MGCLCSKESSQLDYSNSNKNSSLNKSSVLLVAPGNQSVHSDSSSVRSSRDGEDSRTRIIERPKDGYKRQYSNIYMNSNGSPNVFLPNGNRGEQSVAGWPSWLTSVAGEAIQGWLPRSVESYQKLDKIGQGTYSSVYKAKDLLTNKTVAMKKVRFTNMDPESVRFMAREIYILRKLDHPNVMKLEALVTSRMSGSLYLVFEYMEHDLAGLAASPDIKFTESQIKCYMRQLLLGLQHCHSRGILHRDIKGSNLLVDDNGVLKIGDFGLANFFGPRKTCPLTSRVVTLWYRAPELLLGSTDYGVSIDMWSVGCILAELFVGKPIMPGRTEVEQMHKIFKLCGSPSEEYWKKSKLPHATSFKPQRSYKRYITEIFKDFPPTGLALVDDLLSIEPDKRSTATAALNSEFFRTHPLPCDPSSISKYPPSKELDAKLRDEEARRRRAAVRATESARGPRNSKDAPARESGTQEQNKVINTKYNHQESRVTKNDPIEPSRVVMKNGYVHSNSVIHPSAVGYARAQNGSKDSGLTFGRTCGSAVRDPRYERHQSHIAGSAIHPSFNGAKHNKNDYTSTIKNNDYAPKRNRMLCSGPLVSTGVNMDDMLKEHERHIQEAVRKARTGKTRK